MPADLRQIDADFREWFVAGYKPLCVFGELYEYWILPCITGRRTLDIDEAAALIYAAAAQAWATLEAPRNAESHWLAKVEDFHSLESLHAAIGAWHERKVTP